MDNNNIKDFLRNVQNGNFKIALEKHKDIINSKSKETLNKAFETIKNNK